MRLFACLTLVAACAIAADPTTPTTPTTPVSVAPDPATAVVAEGRFIYRQRDVEALMLIAKRHVKGRLSEAEQEVVRLALVRLLTAREPFTDALSALPPSFPTKAREALVLDLLDYQADPSQRSPKPDSGTTVAGPTTSAQDPVLVRLPPLTLRRSLKGLKYQLVLGLALHFRDPELAKRLENKAPLIQDAILAHAQKLPDASFIEPDQASLKDGLMKAVLAKVPDFPADGILIPQLETSDGATETR